MDKISVIILAGGKGTRLIPLTNTTPKPLLKIAGKTAIEHNLEAILPYIKEIVIVVGFLQQQVKDYFEAIYKGIPVHYVEQKEQLGTAHALHVAADSVSSDKFILMYGDDLYEASITAQLLTKEIAVVGEKQENWQNFGILKLKDDNLLDHIIEKPKEFVGDLANIGVYLLSKKIFSYFDKIQKSIRGEYEFTDMLTLYASDHPIEVVEVESGWVPLSYPWDILAASANELENITDDIAGTIEPGATVKGKLILGKGSIIKSGAYLEGNFMIGQNCVIGPNCYLREFAVIGDDCSIGNAVEITRSVIGDMVNIKHLSYIGDSIIGNRVNIGAGTITANLKHNHQMVQVRVNERLIDTKRPKLGAIIGDNARTGINTCIYPGRKIYNDAWTLPGEIVKEDKLAISNYEEI